MDTNTAYLAQLQKETHLFEEMHHWLEANMPPLFFEEIPLDIRTLIVHALMGFEVQEYFSEIHLKKGAVSLCLDSDDADLKILRRFENVGIQSYSTYLSLKPFPKTEEEKNLRVAFLQFFEAPDPQKELEENQKMEARFLKKLKPEHRSELLKLAQKAIDSDTCQYEITKSNSSLHLLIAWRNIPKHYFLYRLASLVSRHRLKMDRVASDYLSPSSTHRIFLLSLDLFGIKFQPAWEACDINDFIQELVSLKFFGREDLIDSQLVATHLITGNLANLLRCYRIFIHQILVNLDPHLYSYDAIEVGLCRHPEITVQLCKAFEAKFHPEKNDSEKYRQAFSAGSEMISLLDTGQMLNDEMRKNILFQALNLIDATLKTNFYKTNKSAIGFRLDPVFLERIPYERKKFFPQMPYGIFFIKGMHYFSFHIRFKDLARGGLRTVFPPTVEKMISERNNVFSECYNLALTQQKKNKDIPEGGAKAVIFLKPYERLNVEAKIYARELKIAGIKNPQGFLDHFKETQRLEYLYQTQRSFIQTLLSLVNCNDDGKLKEPTIIDYWKKPEYLYLGPDENMHNEMIEWIAQESFKEGYKPGKSFISGKIRLGINHKEYGVTSLGVNVYMEEILKDLGINAQKERFTVKMTGGPDGDVAGNQLLNLLKYFPQTAKVVALTDVSGTIYDPEGIDLRECAELFKTEKPITSYPPQKLHSGGFLLDMQTKSKNSPLNNQILFWKKENDLVTEHWIDASEANTIYRLNVHKTPADVFIPCGGRPKTLRKNNWEEFLVDGKPTSRAIVEGANLYLTPEARHLLEDKGVFIIVDSSANKCGVISSSFEILCGLILHEDEFLALKPQLVKEILEQLKKRAFQEASLLINAHKQTKRHFTDLSEEISNRINQFTDELLNYLETIKMPRTADAPLAHCVLDYCLPVLREKFSERLLQTLPENHLKAIVASYLASQLVYAKGLEWTPSLADLLPLLIDGKTLAS